MVSSLILFIFSFTIHSLTVIFQSLLGTLFDDDHNIHPKTKAAILHIRKNFPDIPFIPVTGKQLISCGSLIDELDLSSFPMAAMHGSVIYSKSREVEVDSSLDSEFVLGVTALMKKHNKTTMLYLKDSVSMASLEQGSQTDWEAVSRGFDPTITDERDSNFLDLVKTGEAKISKVSSFSFRSFTFFVHFVLSLCSFTSFVQFVRTIWSFTLFVHFVRSL